MKLKHKEKIRVLTYRCVSNYTEFVLV